MISAKLDAGQAGHAAIPLPAPPVTAAWHLGVYANTNALPPPPPLPRGGGGAGSLGRDKLTFKDVVANLADKHGVLFMPTTRTRDDGLKVHTFGACHVAIDVAKNLAYAREPGAAGGANASWELVGLDELLAMGKA